MFLAIFLSFFSFALVSACAKSGSTLACPAAFPVPIVPLVMAVNEPGGCEVSNQALINLVDADLCEGDTFSCTIESIGITVSVECTTSDDNDTCEFGVIAVDSSDICNPQCMASTAECQPGEIGISTAEAGDVCLAITGLTHGEDTTDPVPCGIELGSATGAFMNLDFPTDDFLCEARYDLNAAGTPNLIFFQAVLNEGEFFIFFSECRAFGIDDGGDIGGARKRATVFATSTSTGTLTVAASANGDPHLRGPHGEAYDFFGIGGAIYNLFSTQEFVINVLLGNVAENHFIEEIGICLLGQCEQFTLARQRGPQTYINALNRKFGKVGGNARFPNQFQETIELELCQGHRVILTKKVTTRGKRVSYFDVEVEVPGCHDDFDGALGQTYKCKYAEHKEEFVFDRSMEAHFRVDSLKSSFGRYNGTNVSCGSFKSQGGSISGKLQH